MTAQFVRGRFDIFMIRIEFVLRSIDLMIVDSVLMIVCGVRKQAGPLDARDSGINNFLLDCFLLKILRWIQTRFQWDLPRIALRIEPLQL